MFPDVNEERYSAISSLDGDSQKGYGLNIKFKSGKKSIPKSKNSP